MAHVHTEGRWHLPFWPTTRLGHWSVALFGIFLAAFVLTASLVAAGVRGVWIAVFPGFAVFGGGIGAFVTGLVAVLRRRERSLAVMIAVIIGMLVALFLVGEFAFPQ